MYNIDQTPLHHGHAAAVGIGGGGGVNSSSAAPRAAANGIRWRCLSGTPSPVGATIGVH